MDREAARVLAKTLGRGAQIVAQAKTGNRIKFISVTFQARSERILLLRSYLAQGRQAAGESTIRSSVFQPCVRYVARGILPQARALFPRLCSRSSKPKACPTRDQIHSGPD